MYLYGCSVGGVTGSQYIFNDNANTPYSGMVAYGSTMSLDETIHIMRDTLWGFYDVAIGRPVNRRIRAMLPTLAKHTTPEKIEIYKDALYNKTDRVTNIQENVVVPMFGYDDVNDYYRQLRISGKLHMIPARCPTLYLQSWDD